MLDRINTIIKHHKHFVLYAVIGVTGATLDLVSFLVLFNVLDIPPIPSTIISISLGIINNFILNAFFNFRKRNHLLKRFISFYAVGLLGLLVSIAIIAVLNGLVGLNANLAKIISIPVIVIMQFWLNKRYSFSEEINFKKFIPFMHKYALLIGICILFLVASLAFVARIPYPSSPAAGPDEISHYGNNVEFIIENKRLPVAGVDDNDAYTNCKDSDFGLVTCRYSYVAYPGFNYVVSAVVGVIAHQTFDLSYLVGARLASTLWGLVFIIFLYLATYRITRNKLISSVLTAAAALIPQVIFIFSYINQDAHSLAISAIVGYALVRFLQDPNKKSSAIILGIAAGGFLPLAKYNYFLLFPIVVGLALFCWYKKIVTRRHLLVTFYWSVAAFLILASFWYTRNLILYGDLLGQKYILELMAEKPFIGRSLPLNTDTVQLFAQLGFFDYTFKSFWISLGYMAYYLKESNYEIINAVLTGCVLVYGYLVYSNPEGRKKLSLYAATFIAILTAAVGLSLYNSALYDFQPQGRYVFQLIVPSVALLALSFKVDARTKYVIGALAFISAFCLVGAFQIFITTYL